MEKFIRDNEVKKIKIVVIGDALVDEYYAVKTNRISPEFPIMVMFSENEEPINVVPGGAANVCLQMKDWNVDTYLLSVLDDKTKDLLEGIDTSYSVSMSGWMNSRKKRFYDGDFPLKRWDIEIKPQKTDTPDWDKTRKQLINNFKKMIENVDPDIVIVSDYGKGIYNDKSVSSEIIFYCNKNNIKTIVDPKNLDYNYWKDCFILKPNSDWISAFNLKYDISTLGQLNMKVSSVNIVATDSGNGVNFYNHCGYNKYFTAHELSERRPVIRSVIGAGDCFCAFLAMATARRAGLEEAIKIAFNGSSAYIEDKHNSPVTPYRFHKWFDPIEAKLVKPEQLVKRDFKLVMTNGCFDAGLTRGHVECLKACKKQGEKLLVAINSDKSIKKLKGENRPIYPLEDRIKIISSLEYVDFVIPFDEETPLELIKKIKPNLLAKGGDYKPEEVAGYGFTEIMICPQFDCMSTTEKIRQLCQKMI